jgi:hypothetical protein
MFGHGRKLYTDGDTAPSTGSVIKIPGIGQIVSVTAMNNSNAT